MCSLDRLQCACNLGVRGSEQAGDLLGQRLVGGEPVELALPEIEIAPGKHGEIACVVVGRGHGSTIAHQSGRSLGEHRFRTRKPLLVALRYRR